MGWQQESERISINFLEIHANFAKISHATFVLIQHNFNVMNPMTSIRDRLVNLALNQVNYNSKCILPHSFDRHLHRLGRIKSQLINYVSPMSARSISRTKIIQTSSKLPNFDMREIASITRLLHQSTIE